MTSPPANQAPFFVVGCPRSGTTLLQTILDSHPDVAVPPESHFFRYYLDVINAETPATSPWNDSRLIDDLLGNFRIRSWGIQLDRRSLLESASNTASVVDNLFRQYARSQRKRVWGDKTPQHALYLDVILRVFPQARVIHLVRDGRDVAESYLRAFIGPTHVAICAERWKRYVNTVGEMQSRLPPAQFLKVRYEDLVREPEATGKVLWRFLQLEDPGVLDTTKSNAARIYSRLSYLHENSKEAVSTSHIGRFKHHLSREQVAQFEAIAGEQLQQEAYEMQYNDLSDVESRVVGFGFGVHFIDSARRLVRKIVFRNGRRQLKDDWLELFQSLRRRWVLRQIRVR